MHIQYKEILKRAKPDFVVKYKIIDERRLKEPPFQGIRTNFMYQDDVIDDKYSYTIFPEFVDSNGNIIMEKNQPVNIEGIANMWIVVEDSIDFHRNKLKTNTKGYIIEGFRKIAECEIILVNI